MVLIMGGDGGGVVCEQRGFCWWLFLGKWCEDGYGVLKY